MSGPLRTRTALIATAACLVAGALAAPASAVSPQAHTPGLEFLGESTIAAGATFEGTVVGGLSSWAYDEARDVYYALSDDQGGTFTPRSTPARFYTLRVDLSDGTLGAGDVTVVDVTTLLGANGQPFDGRSLDPEGLTLTRDDTLIITSEGIAPAIPPFVREFDLSGQQIAVLPVPGAFTPSADGTRGVRFNLGFEAAAVAPNGQFLFVGAENAIAQDGPAASVTTGSRARLLRYNLQSGRLDRQYVYETDPVVAPSSGFTVNGLVELLPVNNQFMLAMERSFSAGVGNDIRIYRVAVPGATDVSGVDDLDQLERVTPVQKTLLLNLKGLGLTLDNIEGMTLGPRLPDGRQSLLLVSDNNFTLTPTPQVSQFLAFALD
jgi:3-phytase/alkaline phosphatase D